jgi:hypothetical protein
MRAMIKIKRSGNRLSVGSWSIPFARSEGGSKRASRNFSAEPGIATKDHEIETTSEDAGSVAKPSTSSLIQLAATITRETEKLDAFIRESGSPHPGFDVDAPLDFPKLPKEIEKAREEVVRATRELGDLVTGPREGVRWMAWDVSVTHSCKCSC